MTKGESLISLYLTDTSGSGATGAALQYGLQYLVIMMAGLIPFAVNQSYATNIKETGQTLVKYITDVKMMKAKVMLEEGTLKIVQIAKACGYENQSYFNKLFKNYYGITPKQLREKI